ncbi:MAG: von Willebrand factor type A domain-containing protein [Acidobacteria bacterium]|nr:von Willebrand factor type A domain-containing protein [Acidobacteriota bacterium]
MKNLRRDSRARDTAGYCGSPPLVVLSALLLVLAYLALFPAMVPAGASATGGLEGRVIDAATGQSVVAAEVSAQGAGPRAMTGDDGRYRLDGLPPGTWKVKCRAAGYETEVRSSVKVFTGGRTTVDFALEPVYESSDQASETHQIHSLPRAQKRKPVVGGQHRSPPLRIPMPIGEAPPPPFNTESYDPIHENPFESALDAPLSTFSIDVDTASYANMRRFIEKEHRLPPIDAVRIEELINYFSYDYPDPDGPHPFSVVTEVSVAPWNPNHRLVHIGLQGKRVETAELPPNNLVFLLDVSGSMNSPAKLPLLKAAFRLLVENLRAQDRVAIVVYAGAAGLVLPPTPGNEKDTIFRAIDGLAAGGSTAGGAGIRLAYEVARRNFRAEANNRVILATDGDFNIGPSSDAEMVRLIEGQRDGGIFLSVLGFGTGNYKDSKMERLADHGNGTASYIDSILEAKKVLVSEMGGILLTIAKDVKIQVEFNPVRVKGYRLIGYENRLLRNQDFSDDTKDAGELGAGHSVTVLYEIVPAGSDEKLAGVDELKYQESRLSAAATASGELLTVKLRYKTPDSDTSKLVSVPLEDEHILLDATSADFRFAAAVAEFGMLLRDSDLKGNASYESVLSRAGAALAGDGGGYRAEFLELVEQARLLEGASGPS